MIVLSGKSKKNVTVVKFSKDDRFFSAREIIYPLKKETSESLRQAFASIINQTKESYKELYFNLNDLALKDKGLRPILEGIYLASYEFNKYKTDKKKLKLEKFYIDASFKNFTSTFKKLNHEVLTVANEINFAKDLINEPFNMLGINEFVKRSTASVVKKKVKITIWDEKKLKQQNMNLFLAVNAGSSVSAKLVKLEYSPKGAKKSVVLVGKGLVYDTGGLCLKRSDSMYTMKTDMAGAASVLAVFNTLVSLNVKTKLTVLLGITDNAISNTATYPDSIVKARNGKTVEIVNTDAEGRLVLADLLDYASSLKSDLIIDLATLTGAVTAALGKEVTGVLGNNQKLIDAFINVANSCDELVWQLPIFDIYKKDIESTVADLQNIGKHGGAGCQKAAAFLLEFVKGDWIHLDIAGSSFDQNLPYARSGMASGLIIRSLVNYLENF